MLQLGRIARDSAVVGAGLLAYSVLPAWAGPGTSGATMAVSGVTPFAGCTADDVPGQIGTVFPNSEVEPWIAASTVDRNGDDASDVIVGYQQDRWSVGGGARGVVASVLFNGTFHQVVIPGTSACAGGLRYVRATDPWVAIAPNGDAYFFTLAIDDVDPLTAILVNKSIDGGLTWSAPVVLVDDNTPEHINDKNSITADPFDSDFVYAIWTRSRFPSDDRYSHSLAGSRSAFRGDAYFSRTTDGGVTWETPRAIFAPNANQYGSGHQITVIRAGDQAGRLVDSFTLFYGVGAKKGQEIAVIVSDDRGATWSDPITVSKMMPGFVTDPDNGTRLRTGDIFTDIGAGPNGELYLVWQEATLAPSGSAIAFSKSLDGGQTWSEPVRINTRPDTQAFTPSIEARADGTIAVTHYDLRNNTADPATLPTDFWFLHSHDGGATWTEVRVTPTSFDHKVAPFARGLFLGDYTGLTVRGTEFVSAYATTTAADPASILVSTLSP